MRVVALRGIPGAGKDHYIHRPRDFYSEYVSADTFFMKDGVYAFDPAGLGEAHLECYRDFLAALPQLEHYSENATLYVNNTNLHAWEIAPYERYAAARGVPFQVVTLWCPFEVALRRQTHKVPPDKLFQMYQTLTSERLPAHWKHEVIDHT
jgi:predicted kinase